METINYMSGGKSITAELIRPRVTPNGGVVVIAYGSDGLVDNPHGPWATMIRSYGRDLADQGFAAIIPDYFQRTDTQPGDIDFENGGAALIWMHRNDWQITIADAVAHAKGLPEVDAARVGLLGFSLGGHLCLRARAGTKALVEFFAPIFDGLGPGGPALKAQIHHGLNDTMVGFADNASRIDRVLRADGATTELFSYEGATHGFVGTDPANTKARALSKERTLSFFDKLL